MKHMAQRRRRRWPWLVVCCVLFVSVFVWLSSGPATMSPGPSLSEPVVYDAADGAVDYQYDSSTVSEEGASASAGQFPDTEDAAADVNPDTSADELISEQYEATYTAPDPDTLEPGTPAAQAFSPEADATVAEAGTDADLPRHVEEEVLLSIPEGTTRAELEEMLGDIDFVSLENASESDLAMGFVALPLVEGISVTEAAARLQYVDGIDYAEPNLILTLADDIASPTAFARILDPMVSLQAAAAIGDELTQELTALTTESVGEEEDADKNEAELPEDDHAGDITDESDLAPVSEIQEIETQADNPHAQLNEPDNVMPDGAEALVTDLEAASESHEPDDPELSRQWALGAIDVYRAWALAKCEGTIGVAVIDTGVLTTHEDLVAAKDKPGGIISDYYNSYTQTTGAASVSDGVGHGTHVAGIVGARANNGLGVAGVSYNANLLIIKASEETTSNFSADSVARAIGWLLEVPSGSTQTRAQKYNIHIINLSVAGKVDTFPSENDVLLTKIREAAEAGILTICAAGNSGNNISVPYASYPGDYPYALSVINVAQSGANVVRASGSNYNVSSDAIAKDISAPGTSIYSTWNANVNGVPYRNESGTSMASPCVAGVAALMVTADPSLPPSAVMSYLQSGAKTSVISSYSQQGYGFGMVDAYASVAAVKGFHISGKTSLFVGDTTAFVVKQGSEASASAWLWESSNSAVAAIDSDGNLTALAEGTATIRATNVDDDSLACELDITVSRQSISAATIKLDSSSYVYDGTAKKPAVTVTLFGSKLGQGSDYTVTYSNNTKIGTATVTVAGVGRYTGTKKQSFTITGRTLTSSMVTLAQAEYVYDGKAKTPAVVVRYNGAILKQGTDYTVTYASNTAEGTATATITGKGVYTGTVKKTFAIVRCSISGNSTAYVGLPVRLAASQPRSWTWSSSNASVAAVSSAGVVTPYKAGTVTITARSGSLSCTKTITVASSAFFVYNVNSGLALDVKGASTASEANVQQYAGNRSRAQRWRLEYAKGHFVVRNVGSGMVLDVRGGSKQSGANVQQYKYNGSNAQLWDAVLRSDGTYELVNYGSGMALDVSGGSKKNSANVQQYRRNSSNAQGWRFTPIARTVADGTYRISSAVNTGFVIDLKGGSSANGAAIQLYKWNASAAQQWKLTFDVPTGYYRITSVKTGRAIDVPGARNANGVKLQQYTSNGSWAQLWDVRQNNDGTYTFVSALGGRVIDLPSSRATNSNRLQTWTSNSSKAQRWRLTKV